MLFQTLRFQNKSVSDFTIKLMIQLVLLTTLAPVVITAKGMMPITLQTLVILFGSIAFGWRIGFIATLLYLVLGFSGFPVFADYTSGITKLYGPYGGYFFGFLVAALVTGYLTELEMFSKQVTGIILWFIGHLIVLACGLFWTVQMGNINWWEELQFLLPAAAIKSVFGALFVQIIYKIVQRFNKTS
jgi:biotin transport system substrate-specific component